MPPGSGTPSGDTSQAHSEPFLPPQRHRDLPLAGWHSAGVPQSYSADDDAREVQVKMPTIFSAAG